MNYSYDRRAATLSEGAEWVLENAFDRALKSELEHFLMDFTKQGQEINAKIEASIQAARRTVEGGEAITERDVLQAVRKLVEHRFGADTLAKALSTAIATGDGFF